MGKITHFSTLDSTPTRPFAHGPFDGLVARHVVPHALNTALVGRAELVTAGIVRAVWVRVILPERVGALNSVVRRAVRVLPRAVPVVVGASARIAESTPDVSVGHWLHKVH